jgi:hypothetical protein
VSQERVDKRWVDVGLDQYSSEAILGTLNHYGIAIDEAAFRRLAEEKYPFTMAGEWVKSWKGTGKFNGFPLSAAGVLWNRWIGRLTPEKVGVALLALSEGKAEALDELEKLLPQLPGKREPFMRELQVWIDNLRMSLEGIIDQKPELAARVAKVSDALFPERAEVVKALLANDAAALAAIARDGSRPAMVRLAAVDALAFRQKGGEVFDALVELQAKAVEQKDPAVLMALHAATHVLGPQLSSQQQMEAQAFINEQHEVLHRLGYAAH